MQLVVESGAERGQAFRLSRDRMVIGRAPGSDVHISRDELVSRRHAELRRQGPSWIVSDLDSRNGTRVNGRRISRPERLEPGDRLRVGHTTLALEAGSPLATYEPQREQVRSVGPAVAASGPKDPGIALILEVVPGLLGFLGIGWMYAGHTARGIGTLLGYWLLIAIEVLLGSLIGVFTLGLAFCVIVPLTFVIHAGLIGLSAYQLNTYVKRSNQVGVTRAHAW